MHLSNDVKTNILISICSIIALGVTAIALILIRCKGFESDDFKFFVTTALGIVALGFTGRGLHLWKKQLRGEDLYTNSKEVIFVFLKLLNLIREYTYIFLAEDNRYEIWTDIQKHFDIYQNKVMMLKFLSDDKVDDFQNKKNMDYYLTKILQSRYERNHLQKDEIPIEQRKEAGIRLKELDKILIIRNEDEDDFGIELKEYFEGMCKKLKKYIKI
jgi:hypothetical protein